MFRTTLRWSGALALALLASPADAQSLGTFRWQLLPYCNVLTVSVVQAGTVYRIEGTDDQCGGNDAAAVTGLAFPNGDGTIGFGLTIVTSPAGAPVHVDAELTLPSLSGTWRDSLGGNGTFAFTPGARSGGSTARPATGAGGLPGSVVLLSSGTAPATSGARLLWHAPKEAFRAGEAEFGAWNDANIGTASAAFGRGTLASGRYSTAFGEGSAAGGESSMAGGVGTQALGTAALAAGAGTVAQGNQSAAFGTSTRAAGRASAAFGEGTFASQDWSLAVGLRTTASGQASFAAGMDSVASGNFSFASGDNVVAGAAHTFAAGLLSQALGVGSIALGNRTRTTAAATGSIVIADRSSVNFFESNLPNEFGVRAAGGVYFYTRGDLGTGVALAPNGSSWAALSDVHAKENFRDVDGEDVLARLARVPVREWNYRAQGAEIRHIGPTAQDFRAAFGVGDFPTRINTIDADGVALAAIKALEARTLALGEANAVLQEENAGLRSRLARLEALLERR
jgi:hypothetical protein